MPMTSPVDGGPRRREYEPGCLHGDVSGGAHQRTVQRCHDLDGRTALWAIDERNGRRAYLVSEIAAAPIVDGIRMRRGARGKYD